MWYRFTALTILGLDISALVFLFSSARREGWTNLHRFALVAGALLTYCWSGFFTLVVLNGRATIPSHACLVLVFFATLALLWRKLRTDNMKLQ